MRFSGKCVRVAPGCPPGPDTEGMSTWNPRIMAMGEFPVMGYIIKLLCTPWPCKIDIILPEDDLMCLCHSGSDLHDGCGSESIVKELFLPAPGNLNRSSRHFCKPCRLHGLLIIVLSAKPGSHKGSDDSDSFRGNPQGVGHFLFGTKGTLGRCPDGCSILIDFGKGGVRLNRCMSNIMIQISRLKGFPGRLFSLIDVPPCVTVSSAGATLSRCSKMVLPSN